MDCSLGLRIILSHFLVKSNEHHRVTRLPFSVSSAYCGLAIRICLSCAVNERQFSPLLKHKSKFFYTMTDATLSWPACSFNIRQSHRSHTVWEPVNISTLFTLFVDHQWRGCFPD